MPKRTPHELTTGTALADDVYNLDGNLLFRAGTILSEKRIEILMMWGVENVTIQGSETGSESISIQSFSNTVKQDAESQVKKRFKLVKSSHPAVVAIRELAVLELAKSTNSDT